MRKKSHVLLARYLADQIPAAESLQNHRKAFCLGSILPDLRPSFLTKKHEFSGTIEETSEKLFQLVREGDEICERVFWRRLGEVLHYIADYFTFPHNSTFTGNLYEHGQYEKQLKNQLRYRIRSGSISEVEIPEAISFEDPDELVTYIRDRHDDYLESQGDIGEDIQFILSVCYQVLLGVVELCDGAFAGYACAV